MKYSKVTSIFISGILVCHILAGISYGLFTTSYWNTIRNYSVDTEGALNYSKSRAFNYWFSDAKMKYSYTLKQGESKQENCFLMLGFADRTMTGTPDQFSKISVFNKQTKEEVEYELCPSSLVLPIEKENEGWMHLLCSIFGFLIILYSFLIFHLIKKVLDSVKIGSPFINDNVIRLRRISLMLLVLPIGILLFEVGIYYSIVSKYILLDYSTRPSFDFNLGLFMGGVVLIFISETFKQGIRIREEQELTI